MKIEIFLDKMKSKNEGALNTLNKSSSYRLAKLLKSMFPKGKILIEETKGLFFFELDGKIHSANETIENPNMGLFKEPTKAQIKEAEEQGENYYNALDRVEIDGVAGQEE